MNIMSKLLLIVLLAVGSGFAQGKRNSGGGSDMGGVPMMQSQSRLDRIEMALKLNHEQKKQVKSILDDGQKEAAPVRDQLVKSELDIGEAVAGGKSQDEIGKAVAGCGELLAQMAGIEMKAFAKIYQALDKDQQPNAGSVFFMMQGIFKTKNWNETRQ
jgi:hypothetical protein